MYTGIAENLRLIEFRLNFDQNFSVFEELGKEMLTYDRELQRAAEQRAADESALH
jgi:hypothetical protein